MQRKKIAAIVAGAVLLCCCGGTALGAMTTDAPSTTPSPTPSASVSVIKSEDIIDEPDVDVDDDNNSKITGVTPGAFCGDRGAIGFTKTGRMMTCKGPGDLRWRS